MNSAEYWTNIDVYEVTPVLATKQITNSCSSSINRFTGTLFFIDFGRDSDVAFQSSLYMSNNSKIDGLSLRESVVRHMCWVWDPRLAGGQWQGEVMFSVVGCGYWSVDATK